MSRLFAQCACFAAGLALGFAAYAQQYKWVDKDGRLQYGDVPPPGVKATPMRGASSAPGPNAASKGTPSAAEKDADFRKRQLEASKDRDKQSAAAADSEAKKQNCSNAQASMRTLEMGRVRRVDPVSGEPYYLSDEQLASETARTRKSIADFCS